MSKEEIIRDKMDYVFNQAKAQFHDESFRREWSRFYGAVFDCDWSPESFETEIAGVVDSFISYGRNCRWGKDPAKAIELLSKLELLDNRSFHEWFKENGRTYPLAMSNVFMYEYLRLLCIEYAGLLIAQQNDV